MKKLLLLFFICALFMGKETNAQEIPVIKVDYEHWLIERNDGSSALEYEIPLSKAFVIDAAGYTFTSTPNLIFISLGENYKYGVAWQPETKKYTISKDTLSPLAGSEPFPGFEPRQEVAVFIGQIDNATGNFYPLWYSLIKIRQSNQPANNSLQ